MKKLYFLSLLLGTALTFGQNSITALNTAYTQNFDGMTATGTAFPTNWTAIRASGSGTANQVLTMAVTDGGANSGNIYNVGTTGQADRAFGTLASGSTVPAFGTSFINNTGNQITEFNITLLVEQWRSGSSETINEIIAFSYSTNATGLDNGTWTNATQLNLNEILTTTITAAAVDGSSPANQSTLNATINISSTPVANGGTLWIKWTDENDGGSDGLLAIDDFNFRATSSVLSTASFNAIEGLKMYPNPLTGTTLNFSSAANADMSVQIFDILGKEVLSAKVVNNAVNTAKLNAGIYIVKITEEGNTATRKLVVR